MRAIAIGVLLAGGRPVPARADGPRLSRARVPAPVGVLTRLPGEGNQLALTVDDGTNTAVVAAFAEFCRDSGTRLTFFPNGANASWTVNAPVLRPMVDSGQIQLGNHTWSHPNLTHIRLDAVADQIRRNADFLRATYGVDGTPYFRPPYGAHTPDVDRVAADQGYSTITLWSGSVGDSRPVNEQQLVTFAQQSFTPQQIILAHANLPPITQTYSQLLDIINNRGLQTVTLADVFA
jgi:peptidoglycan/xylan/chitin deacetylase (PgdA/CDA1 family)